MLPMNEIIQGTLSSIFRQFDNGYLIASIDPGGHKVVGTLPNPVIGDKLEFHGRWETHPQYGRQFHFDLAVIVAPKTEQDMLEFLSQLKHIGPVRARAIMDKFGDSIFEVLDNNPQQLTAIPGITSKRVKIIIEEWNRIKADKDTIFFLNGLGCTPRQRALIMDCYKEKTIETVKENPYRMIRDIQGFGFKTVDNFAMQMGIEGDSLFRAEAAVEHILNSYAEAKQHTYLPEYKIFEKGAGELGISRHRLKEALDCLEKQNTIVRNPEEEWCALRWFHDREKNIADRLRQLIIYKTDSDTELEIRETFIDPVSGQTITLNDKQLEAVKIACNNNVSIITGLPGTGKTTLLKAILNIYQDNKIELASPTGKAAKRMEEATGWPARTVHRLLEYHPDFGFRRNRAHPLKADLIIIDEISMMDVWLMGFLLNAITPGTKLIFVGDADQLPSVGPGNVLADMLACEWIPSIKLTQIMRQAEASDIIMNAHRINRGLPINIYGRKDFFFIEEYDPDLLVKRIEKLVTTDIPKKFNLDPVNDIQVLCPQNIGPIGSIVFNNVLQCSLNPAQKNKPEIEIGYDDSAYFLRIGDRVIQTVNNYDLGVFNGTTGVIVDVDPKLRRVWVDFSNGNNEAIDETEQFNSHSKILDELHQALDNYRLGRTPALNSGGLDAVEYNHEQLSQLKLAYAISIHKSQGSEFPCVVIPIHKKNSFMLQRNLIYTGITRGKQYVVLVGTEKACDYAIENDRPIQRYTLLKDFLRQGRQV